MKTFFEKIVALDFRKPAKRLFIIAIIVVLAGGALNAWMMRTQIGELAALDQAETQSVQSAQSVPYDSEQDHDRSDKEIDLLESGLVSRPSVPAKITLAGWIVLCGICALAYWLMVAAWLYKASARAGMNRTLWVILGLVTNVLAVAAFLIIRSRLSRCPKCGTWQTASSYCRVCGNRMERKCPKCGKPCASTDTYCPNCGAALTSASDSTEK